MVHSALCRMGCRGEHAGRESAKSCSGALAPPGPARSARPSPALVCAAQAGEPVRIQCTTSKHVHSEGGNPISESSRRTYGHVSERIGPTRRICDALHFWSPCTIVKAKSPKSFSFRARCFDAKPPELRALPAYAWRSESGRGRACRAREGRKCMPRWRHRVAHG